jgi:hypothetical protein
MKLDKTRPAKAGSGRRDLIASNMLTPAIIRMSSNGEA